jgi:RNA polymerase sigma-70 factor (ECF subfamily)
VPHFSTTHLIQLNLERLRQGDAAARDELVAVAYGRLRRRSEQMLRDFPRVGRWADAEDVCQEAAVRLCRAIEQERPESVHNFLKLLTLQIRRELLDLARKFHGPQGLGRQHQSAAALPAGSSDGPGLEPSDEAANRPDQLALWTAFHEQVAALPEQEREVFELLWYHELTQVEAAELLGISESTLKRRYLRARRRLSRLFDQGTGVLNVTNAEPT